MQEAAAAAGGCCCVQSQSPAALQRVHAPKLRSAHKARKKRHTLNVHQRPKTGVHGAPACAGEACGRQPPADGHALLEVPGGCVCLAPGAADLGAGPEAAEGVGTGVCAFVCVCARA